MVGMWWRFLKRTVFFSFSEPYSESDGRVGVGFCVYLSEDDEFMSLRSLSALSCLSYYFISLFL